MNVFIIPRVIERFLPFALILLLKAAAFGQDAPARLPGATLQRGEVAVWGRVVAMDRASGVLQIQAAGFMLADGLRVDLKSLLPRRVRLTSQTQIVDAAGQPVSFEDILRGDWITAIGPDEGEAVGVSERLCKWQLNLFLKERR